jgi:hypothetical protein
MSGDTNLGYGYNRKGAGCETVIRRLRTIIVTVTYAWNIFSSFIYLAILAYTTKPGPNYLFAESKIYKDQRYAAKSLTPDTCVLWQIAD